MKMKKVFAILLTVFLLLGMLAGCGSAENGTASDQKSYAEAQEALYSSTTGSGQADTLAQDRKLVKTVTLRAETQRMDDMLSWLDGKAAELGGYMEQRDIYNGSTRNSSRFRSAEMTLRIPAEKLEAFTEQLEEYSNIISSSQSIEDVTLNYVATESRVKALQAEEERLLELMAQAQTMADLLEIEERLTDVRYELESVTSQLRTLDNQVDYATVYLTISEVRELTEPEPVGLGERIGTGFVNSLKNLGSLLLELGVFLIVNLPYILVLGAIAAVIILLCRRKVRKAKRRAPQKPEEPQA